jgi:hypothetical protein
MSGSRNGFAACCCAIGVMLAALSPVRAEPIQVDLELILAVDVSWSMDLDEQQFQRAGYVAAMRDKTVIDAIVGGGWGRIAISYVEWAGDGLQSVIVPWTLVDSREGAEAFADRLATTRIGRLRRTSISSVLEFAEHYFDENDYEGLRRVVDVSGDGANNQGLPVTALRDRLVSQGVVINGLPIMIKEENPSGYFGIPNLDVYYEDCVIGGPASFVIPVDDVNRFATAIRQKMILEIAGRRPEVMPATYATAKEPRIDCLIGEKMWREWRERYDEW